jgi:hypothetical protein
MRRGRGSGRAHGNRVGARAVGAWVRARPAETARRGYQTRQTSCRTMGCPALQAKASANSGMLETTALTR